MDLSALNRFIRKAEEWQDVKLGNACNQISKAVQMTIKDDISVYEDAEVIRSGISGTSRSQLTVHYVINARDLWYREFGTGFIGKRTFHNWEYLPNYPLIFMSRGSIQNTAGYVHAYHPDTQKLKGWWYVNEMGRFEFTEGQAAEMLLTNSINRMKFNGIPMLAEYVRIHL